MKNIPRKKNYTSLRQANMKESVAIQAFIRFYHSSKTDLPHESLQIERLRNITPTLHIIFVVLSYHRLAA